MLWLDWNVLIRKRLIKICNSQEREEDDRLYGQELCQWLHGRELITIGCVKYDQTVHRNLDEELN